jgi:hypothetical protein
MENAIDKECFGLFAYGIEVGGLLADDGTGVGDTFHFFIIFPLFCGVHLIGCSIIHNKYFFLAPRSNRHLDFFRFGRWVNIGRGNSFGKGVQWVVEVVWER